MKSRITAIAIASVEFKPTDDSVTSNLCVAAATGNRWKLHEQIKESALDKKYVAQDMTCNGLSVAAFVDQYGKNGDSIKKYLNIQQKQIASVVHAK